MAFTSTIDSRPKVMGPLVLYTGTFTNDGGSTGGDVDLASVSTWCNCSMKRPSATDTEIMERM